MTTTIKLDKRFTRQAQGVFGKYQFQVGILEDRIHKLPQSLAKGLQSYAGGPARKVSRKSSGMTISQVSKDLRKKTKINFYTRPFKSKKNLEILAFVKEFMKLCTGKTQARRAETLLQAIVRNPILRGDYGRNSSVTAKEKGFNRFMIDTAQLFKAIVAKVKVKRVSS